MKRLATSVGIVGALLLLLGPAAAAAPNTGAKPDRDAAEKLLDRVIGEQRARQARDRAEADRLVTEAQGRYRKGDYAAAKALLSRALRLDPESAPALELRGAIDRALTPSAPRPAAVRAPAPGEVEGQLRVALMEGRRLLGDGQTLAAIEVLENAERAIALAPAALNLAPYRAETAAVLAAAREAKLAGPPPYPQDEIKPVYDGPAKEPTVFNPDGTRRRGEIGPVPSRVDPQQDRRVITNDRARYWAKPSTYHEEYGFAAAELAVRPIGPTPLLRLPADWAEKSKRRLAEARGLPRWQQAMEAKLDQPLDSKVDFKGVTLTEALGFFRDLTGLDLVVDAAVTAAGLDKRKVTLAVGRIKLRSALNLVAEMTGTAYVLRDEVLLFTTPQKAGTYREARLYFIGDLTQPMINWVEWRPLRPPEKWEADPWWERYVDYYDRWGGFDGAGYPPPFWPPKYVEGQTREERTERLLDTIGRVLGRPAPQP